MADYTDVSLTIPRVMVVWGPYDLTKYVYDVRVSLDEQGQTPTGSMKWRPDPAGYADYETLIEAYREWSIMVTFYYIEGKFITFEFYWGGQSEVYGKEMEITVKLVSLLDGLVNANFYASVQTAVGEKGISFAEAASQMLKQFGLAGLVDSRGQPMDLLRYTKKAREDTNNATVKFNYNDGATFMDAVQNLVKDNGNNVFFNNIGSPNAVVYTPYTWEYEGTNGVASGYETVDAITAGWDLITNPDPTLRYGYIIGPGIIQSFTRTYEWQPPQKSQEITAMMNRKAEERKEAKRQKSLQDKKKEQSAQNATAPSGVYQSKTTGNIKSENNESGPRKQDIFTKERSAKLSLSTLMCPALTGIKPLDIIFIPSYSGKYIEDWIVSSVEYQQNDKGVDLSIQATRPYGQGKPMSDVNSDRFSGFAMNFGLTGNGVKGKEDVLRNWTNFAWTDRLVRGRFNQPSTPSTSASSDIPATYEEYYQKSLETLRSSKPIPPSQQLIGVYDLSNNKNPKIKAFMTTNFPQDRSRYVYTVSNDKLFEIWLEEAYTGSDKVIVGRYPVYRENELYRIQIFFTGDIDQKKIFAKYEEFNKIRANYLQQIEDQYRREFESASAAQPAPTPAPVDRKSVESPLTLQAPPPTPAAESTTPAGPTVVPGQSTPTTSPGTTPQPTQGQGQGQPPTPQPSTSPANTLNLQDLSKLVDNSYKFSPTTAVVASPDGKDSYVNDPLFANFIETGGGGLLGNLEVEGSSADMVNRGGKFLVKGADNLNRLRESFGSTSFEGYRKDKKTRLF